MSLFLSFLGPFKIIEVLSYFRCQGLDFTGQFRIVLPEHITDAGKIPLVLDQHSIVGQLFLGQAFDDRISKSRTAAIFGEGNTGPFRPFL